MYQWSNYTEGKYSNVDNNCGETVVSHKSFTHTSTGWLTSHHVPVYCVHKINA